VIEGQVHLGMIAVVNHLAIQRYDGHCAISRLLGRHFAHGRTDRTFAVEWRDPIHFEAQIGKRLSDWFGQLFLIYVVEVVPERIHKSLFYMPMGRQHRNGGVKAIYVV